MPPEKPARHIRRRNREGKVGEIPWSTADGRHFLSRVRCDDTTFFPLGFSRFSPRTPPRDCTSKTTLFYFLFLLSTLFSSPRIKQILNKKHFWKIKRWILFFGFPFGFLLRRERERNGTAMSRHYVTLLPRTPCRENFRETTVSV